MGAPTLPSRRRHPRFIFQELYGRVFRAEWTSRDSDQNQPLDALCLSFMTSMLSHALRRRLEKLVVVVSPEHLTINELGNMSLGDRKSVV